MAAVTVDAIDAAAIDEAAVDVASVTMCWWHGTAPSSIIQP